MEGKKVRGRGEGQKYHYILRLISLKYVKSLVDINKLKSETIKSYNSYEQINKIAKNLILKLYYVFQWWDSIFWLNGLMYFLFLRTLYYLTFIALCSWQNGFKSIVLFEIHNYSLSRYYSSISIWNNWGDLISNLLNYLFKSHVYQVVKLGLKFHFSGSRV